ncbi:MAG: ferritin-like domain-containing protein, partial [Gammaproteobacteria bacterium]|nr:ferritin-like domain-containing protein [Gammaproteobacteria bacterium]
MTNSFFLRVYECLMTSEPALKVSRTIQCFDDLNAGLLSYEHNSPVKIVERPGRPDYPLLVDAREVPKRSLSVEGRGILAHAVAHIEFNAINLALDAAYRFRDMPEAYYQDWIKIAKEEAEHFTLMVNYLESHGHNYGDYSAHNGLWEMALKTDNNVLERMALVPRVLEARGLDVTPGMIKKLEKVGDKEFVDCLKIIHKEEIGHVAIGSRWYQYSCDQEGVDARTTFLDLIKKHVKNAVRGPFDEWSRLQAGFTEDEMT